MPYKKNQNLIKKISLHCRIFIVFLSLILPFSQSFAKIDNNTLRFYSKNNILYYDPTGSNRNCLPSSGSVDGIWQSQPDSSYTSMTDAQRNGLIHAAIQENSCNDTAFRTELSFMANLYDTKNKTIFPTLYDYVKNSGWFGENDHPTQIELRKTDTPDQKYIDIYNEVILEGKRNLPPEIQNYDCIGTRDGCNAYISNDEGDTWIKITDQSSTDRFDRSLFIPNKTRMKNIGGDSGYSIFYRFMGGAGTDTCGDPLGYLPDTDVSSLITTTASLPDQVGSVAVGGTTIEEKIWSGLTKFLTDEQAAGVMGNMVHESNFNPAQHEKDLVDKYPNMYKELNQHSDISYGIGLIQWSYSRRISLYNYIESKDASLLEYLKNRQTYSIGYAITGEKFLEIAGDSATTNLISLELEFLKDELNNVSGFKGFLSTKTVEEATEFFLKKIEKPSKPDSKVLERTEKAQQYYKTYHGTTIASPCGSGAIGNVSQLQEYVLKYAWPDHHDAPFTERMPDYINAVNQHKADNKYIGGHEGVDCGAFVTILLQDSGFEPNYNDDNDKGGTSRQEQWVKDNGWTRLNPSGAIDTSVLQPGDVAFITGHTWVYVGEIEGFNSVKASASLGERAPMAALEGYYYINDGDSSSEPVRWYGKR